MKKHVIFVRINNKLTNREKARFQRTKQIAEFTCNQHSGNVTLVEQDGVLVGFNGGFTKGRFLRIELAEIRTPSLRMVLNALRVLFGEPPMVAVNPDRLGVS